MKEIQKAILEFHKKHGFPYNLSLKANKGISKIVMWIFYKTILCLSKLAIKYWKITGSSKESFYRVHLILEELSEMIEGINNGDEIKTADGIGDLLYVVIGTATVYSLPADEIIKEVCKSNKTKKLRTKDNVRMRNKGEDWRPPDFEKAIKEGRKRLQQENQI